MQPQQSQPGLSRIRRHGSRIDALDAAHEIDNTAADAWQPFGLNENVRSGPALHGKPKANGFGSRERSVSQRPLHESDDYDAEDDVHMEELDEPDESIKTRKGLASLKTQPGGGRNLDLLRGLASQTQSHTSLQVNGSAMRSVSPMSQQRSPSPAETVLPSFPGAFPGQGSALLARRATATDHTPRSKGSSSRQRTTSAGQRDSHRRPFRDWSALVRTPETMAQYENFLKASTQHTEHTTSTTAGPSKLPYMPHATGSALVATLAGSPKRSRRERSISAHDDTHMQRNRSRSMIVDEFDEPDLRLWQIATSEQFARAALPALPFARSSASDARTLERRKRKRRKADVGEPEVYPSHLADDIRNLEHSKYLHRRISALRHDDGNVYLPEEISDTEDDTTSQLPAIGNRARRSSKSHPAAPELLAGTDLAKNAARSAVHHACTTVLRYAGFDGKAADGRTKTG